MRGNVCNVRRVVGLSMLMAGCGFGLARAPLRAQAPAAHSSTVKKPACSRAVIEGDVKAGQGFDVVFTKGLRFYLEPLRSGWIVRVLAADGPRGSHDYAELATPPYRSVSPLLISTDWSFRAQDAVGWNPRRFRYAADRQAFDRLAALYDGVMANDAASSAKTAALVSAQPEAELEIMDAQIAPGLANQARMAAAVSAYFAGTPHTVDQQAAPSPLGAMEHVRFRVLLDLPAGHHAAAGIHEEPAACTQQLIVVRQPAEARTHPSK